MIRGHAAREKVQVFQALDARIIKLLLEAHAVHAVRLDRRGRHSPRSPWGRERPAVVRVET